MWYPTVVGARVAVPVNGHPSDPWFTWGGGFIAAAPRGPRMVVRLDNGRRTKVLKISARPAVETVDANATFTAQEWMWGASKPNTPRRCFEDAMVAAKQ